MCSGSEAGSNLRLIDLVYHSTLGLRVTKKKIQEIGARSIILVPEAGALRLWGCVGIWALRANLLWKPHNLASLGALRAQIPTGWGFRVRGLRFGVWGLGQDAGREVQGYFAHNKPHPPRTLQ